MIEETNALDRCTPGEWKVIHPPIKRNPNTGYWEVESGDLHVASHLTLADAHMLAASKKMYEAALKLLKHRTGDLPSQGWLRDNDESRVALAGMAEAVKAAEGHARAAISTIRQRGGASDPGMLDERIARLVAWEYYGVKWEHLELVSRNEILARVEAMLKPPVPIADPAHKAALKRHLETQGILPVPIEAGKVDPAALLLQTNRRIIEARTATPSVSPDVSQQAREAWEQMIEDEAVAEAERENEATGQGGPYGTSTAEDYRDEVRKDFEEIGRAYVALSRLEVDREAGGVERLPAVRHARDCAYVTSYGPAACTCDFYDREQTAILALLAPTGNSDGEGKK